MVDLPELLDEYYARADLYPLDAVARREFAFQAWDAPGPNDRHHTLSDMDLLRSIIRIKKPKAVFASNARYLDPGHPTMAKKTNIGVDLAFDFDFGDLPEHELTDDFWGNMDAVAVHVQRLLDDVFPSLGLDADEALVTFSGGKGFHVRVMTDDVLRLNRNQRKMIQDYVRGYGLEDFHTFGRGRMKGGKYAPSWSPGIKGGWPGHYSRAAEAYLRQVRELPYAAAIEFVKANLPIIKTGEKKGQKKNPTDETIVEIVETIRSKSSMLTGGVFKTMFRTTKHGSLVGESVAQFAVLMSGCAIDPSVTHDMRRILRLPGSIHGKTGLPCVVISRDEINAEAVKAKVIETIGDDMVEVSLKHIVDTPFGAFKDETSLPRYQALAALASARNG